MNCVCPSPAAIETIPRFTCAQKIGQIQRLIFQRAGHTFDTVGDVVTALASWTPLLTAIDSTKIVITPYVEGFVIPESEPITEGGGDNSTIDGVEYVLDGSAVTATGQISGAPGAIMKPLRQLMCETDLVVYFITQYGKIIGRDLEPLTPGSKVTGIPLQAYYTSHPALNGYGTRDKSTIRFALAADWADDLAIITPAFNAKTELLAPLV